MRFLKIVYSSTNNLRSREKRMSHFHDHPHQPRRQFLKTSIMFLSMASPSPAGAAPKKKEGTEDSGRGPHAERALTAAISKSEGKPGANFEVFDAHLHCPSEKGDVWQWHPVTRTFEE